MLSASLPTLKRRVFVALISFALPLSSLSFASAAAEAAPAQPGPAISGLVGVPELLPLAKTTKYKAPTSLKAKASKAGASVIALNWKSKGPGVHYRVKYSTSKRFTKAKTRVVSVASTAIKSLASKTRYYFKVRVVDGAGKGISKYSKVATARTATPADTGARPLRVATFNVRNGTKTEDTGNRAWSVRAPLVAATIKANKLDVVGLQEAQYTYLLGADRTWKHQYQDLLDLLGGSYRITCATEENPTCDRSQNYSAGTRIIYNQATVTLGDSGVKELSIRSGDVRRFLVWAVFTQKSTGRKFFFADTHLDNDKSTAGYKQRIVQTKAVIAEIRQRNTDDLAVILTGDMNSHKWRKPDNAPYKLYVSAGLVDPLGNTDFSRTAKNPTAEVRIHTEFDSWNNFASKPDTHGWANGINVDYVWVSKSITTLEYETVVKIKDSTLKFVGTVPSDHNMIRATLLIPKS